MRFDMRDPLQNRSQKTTESNHRFSGMPRRIIAILLAFSLCFLGLPLGAFAAGEGDEGEGGGEEYPYKSGYIQVDGIYAFDAATYPYGSPVTCGGYGYGTGAWVGDTPTVTESGAQLRFEARGTFVSGNMDDPSNQPAIDDNITMDGAALSWSVSDSSIATIDFQSGLFTPVSNGTVQVTATVSASKSYSGQAFSITFPVTIDVNNSAYITGLTIIAPDGETVIGNSQVACYDLYQYLADATGETDFDKLAAENAPQFYVNVDVYNPDTGSTETYKVRSGAELAQHCGISDLSWGQAADSFAYSIDPTQGMVRLLRQSTVNETIRVYTKTTKDGSLLDDRATLKFSVQSGDISEDESGYIPSDTLTVMAYYQKYPADVNNPDDQYWLRLKEHNDETSVTYSLGQLQSISNRDQAYTMIGTDRSCQAIASGVNLMLLLQDALGPNVAIDDIAGFYFKTFDQGYMPGQYFVSASALFSDRYFYPYYFQGGDLSGAQQVYPILAWNSKLYWSDKHPDINVENPSSWNRDDMSGSSRYRLIFGAQPGSGFSTKNSVYCIQTMYVVLKGGPGVSDGSGDDDDPANPSNPGSDGTTDNPEKPGESGSPSEPGGTAGFDEPQDNPDSNGDQSEENATDQQNKGSSKAEQTDSNKQDATQSTRKQTIYQMMNPKELEVKLAVQNTLGWAVVPLGGAAFAAGVAYAALWFRRQTAPVPMGFYRNENREE